MEIGASCILFTVPQVNQRRGEFENMRKVSQIQNRVFGGAPKQKVCSLFYCFRSMFLFLGSDAVVQRL